MVVLPDAAKGRIGVQGLACSADGQILALGASLTTGRSVLLYREGNWQLVPNPGGATYFGFSIAMSADGNRVAVGCMSGDAPLDKGAVFLYQWDAATSAYVASQTVTPDAGSARTSEPTRRFLTTACTFSRWGRLPQTTQPASFTITSWRNNAAKTPPCFHSGGVCLVAGQALRNAAFMRASSRNTRSA